MGLLPKSVQVAVQIPRDYYRDVARKQGESETDKQNFQAKVQLIETETLKQIRENVTRLIPSPSNGTGTAADHVSVTSYVKLETEQPVATASMVDQATEILTQWGGPMGLGLFTLWVLWTLQRSLKRLPQAPAMSRAETAKAAAEASSAKNSSGDDDSPDEDDMPREATKRDRLQGLVKDNPEMAAAVISRWLTPAK